MLKKTLKSHSEINVCAVIIPSWVRLCVSSLSPPLRPVEVFCMYDGFFKICKVRYCCHWIWLQSFHWLQQWWIVSKNIQLYVAMWCDKASVCLVFFRQLLFYLQSWFLFPLESEGNVCHWLLLELRTLLVRTILQCTIQLLVRIQSSSCLSEH